MLGRAHFRTPRQTRWGPTIAITDPADQTEGPAIRTEIKIGTRGSELALTQTQQVVDALKQLRKGMSTAPASFLNWLSSRPAATGTAGKTSPHWE